VGFGYPAAMMDTEPRNATDARGSGNADWGHPGRDHAAEEQSTTTPSGWAHPADADPQRRAGSHQGSADPADDLIGNTTGAPDDDDGATDPDDSVPGDGSVGKHPPSPDVDAVQTAEHGRETDAARSDTSDGALTPTETPLETSGG
jgi:hypothetical protein